MTSRRSRLKAVTNLPVRRKVVISQGGAYEATPSENITPQKTYPSAPKSGVSPLANSQNNDESSKKDISDSEQTSVVNFAGDLNNTENFIFENVNNKPKSDSEGKLENTSPSSKSLPAFTTDLGSKSFKPNLSSAKERTELQTVEKNNVKQCLTKRNYSVIHYSSTNNSKNNNNSIIEDGNKCYAVLATQSESMSPLSEFTITHLNPCDNAYISSSIGDEYSNQQYEEVHLYTEIESNEMYVNEESVVEAEPSESILLKLSNGGSAGEVSTLHVNFGGLDGSCMGANSVSAKSDVGSKAFSFKNNFSGNFENHRSTSLQAMDTHSPENSVTSGSFVSSDAHSNRQSKAAVRRKRSKCNEFTRKLAEAKREFQKKYEKSKPDRSTLKMIDLIFYNPATNPMESKNKFEKKDASSNEIENLLAEEKVDEPDALDCSLRSQMSDNEETENMQKMPVPQVKIGVDGEIILDEKSVIIETTDAKKGREELQNSVPVFEDRGCNVSYYKGKSRKSKDWTDFETKRFYKALNTIGPDFSLMQKYFPKRSRSELKNKFKREEKLNRNLIDKALNNPSEFDMTELEKDLAIEKEAEEEEIEMRLCKIIKRSRKKHRVKSSVLSREMIESDEESDNSQSEMVERSSRQLLERDKSKKKMEFDFVLQKLLMKD